MGFTIHALWKISAIKTTSFKYLLQLFFMGGCFAT